jgi:hypothetical protein
MLDPDHLRGDADMTAVFHLEVQIEDLIHWELPERLEEGTRQADVRDAQRPPGMDQARRSE